jgi:hypothetical protein
MSNPVKFLEDKVNDTNYKKCYSDYLETCKPYPSNRDNYCEIIGDGIHNYIMSDVTKQSNKSAEAMGKCIAHPWCDVSFSKDKKCVSNDPNSMYFFDNCNEIDDKECTNNTQCVFKTVPVCIGKD